MSDEAAPIIDKPRSGHYSSLDYWSCEHCGWTAALTTKHRVRRHNRENNPDLPYCPGSYVEVRA